MAIGDLLGGMSFGIGGGLVSTVYVIVLALGGLFLMMGIVYYFWLKKQWNLKVHFYIPRSIEYLKTGGSLELDDVRGDIGFEIGKGMYNAKKGAVFVKRKGLRKIPMAPFNINKYLQGTNVLSVVQSGAEDYIPIHPSSFVLYEDENGENCALLKLQSDNTRNKAWKNSFERESKQAFSIANIFREYLPFIMIGLVIFLWGIQTLLILNRLGN